MLTTTSRSRVREIRRCRLQVGCRQAAACARDKTLSATFSSLYRPIVLSRTRTCTSILNTYSPISRVYHVCPPIVKRIDVASIILVRRIYGAGTLIRCDALCVIRAKLGRIRLGRSESCGWKPEAACLQNFRVCSLLALRGLPAREHGGSESDIIYEIDKDVSLNRKL